MKGIDISEHNGNIDFQKVKNSGVEFVIIRVGWIGNKNNHSLDKKFNEYYRQAKAARLKIGFYVYSYCNSVLNMESGVRWTMRQLQDKSYEMPVFLDMEDGSIANFGKSNLTAQCLAFCDYVESQGVKSGVYANKDWFTNKLDVNQLSGYKIWLAEWNGKENHTATFKVDLWQYSSNGTINRNQRSSRHE